MSTVSANNWPRQRALKIREIIEELGLCGCGTSAHWVVTLRILELANTPHGDRNGKSFYENEWWEFAAKVLDSKGLIEHGGGIGGAWITENGELLLDFLREFGTQEHDIQDNSGHPFWATEFSWELEPKEGDWYSEWERTQ